MKIDLHVHSKYSRRPAQWVLRKIGCQECYTDPPHLYQIAKDKGMDWVTITDHNTIAGCMDIAHLPNTFISEEVSAYFPEDRCKIHVLVYELDEGQHQDIQKLRHNVYDLVAYLDDQRLSYALAHPLWSANGRLSLEHFQKLLLLFKNFEINGGRDVDLNELLKQLLAGLPPELFDRLQEKHGIRPAFPSPWLKHLIGGSDDHSSLNIARMHTEVEGAVTLRDFFRGLAQGQAKVRGRASRPLTLAHTIYSIAYQFYKEKYSLGHQAGTDRILTFLDSALTRAKAEKKSLFSWLLRWRLRKSRPDPWSQNTLLHTVRQEALDFIQSDPQSLEIVKNFRRTSSAENQWFTLIEKFSSNFLSRHSQHFLDGLVRANPFDLFQSLTASGAMYFMVLPYVAAFSSFAGDRQRGLQMVRNFLEKTDLQAIDPGPCKVANFTDTFAEINGVALTLKTHVAEALKAGKALTVITCDADGRENGRGIKNFPPLAVLDLPEYQEMKVLQPPFLEMINYCYRENFSHIHASTPGPMGLAALSIARILKLPIFGTYHTALPQYARYLTKDPSVESLMWKYILWFYEQMDAINVPSQSTASELIARGISAAKILVTPHGVDTETFNPAKRNGFLESRYQIRDGFRLLYVGRVSKEKNLELLVRAYQSVIRQTGDLRLIVVGDGPYAAEMRATLADTPAVFTGYLEGEDLSAVYAASDLFVFPSTTDTLGNVVLEAQASGVPVIVTDAGGPQENLLPGVTGLVVPAHDEAGLVKAVLLLVENPGRLKKMGRAARDYVEDRSLQNAFRAAWQMYAAPDSAP
jgi:glycosyltransferase involved in cell wall biosynthesis